MAVATQPNRLNPWTFVPLLYFMQAIPVAIVQEVSTVFYKDLGVKNETIAAWTALIALPWGLQFLLGPLVDLNGTKRRWILGGQLLIAAGIAATAFLLRAPHAFEITLVVLGITAISSALCNIATDGFYLLATDKDQQAKFVGVLTTCSRLGRLFCVGLLTLVVGILMRYPPLQVDAPEGSSFVTSVGPRQHLSLTIQEGLLKSEGATFKTTDKDGKQTDLAAPAGVYGLRMAEDGTVFGRRVTGEEPIGRIVMSFLASAEPPALQPVSTPLGMNPVLAWTIILLSCAGIYFLGHLVNRRTVPHPAEDLPKEPSEPNETQKNVVRTLLLVLIGLSGYFLGNAIVRLGAQGLYSFFNSVRGRTLIDALFPNPRSDSEVVKGWKLPSPDTIVGYDLGVGNVATEALQGIVCAVVLAIAITQARRLIRETPMGDALGSFFRQSGIVPIFAFILFYRFGEAMVAKMSPLFLKGSLDEGGLAIGNEQLGVIKGFAGVVGIILGGLAGAYIVGKVGLRRAFIPLAVCMHLPNLLYLWASTHTMPMLHAEVPGFGLLNLSLVGVDFVDQFGYGFGFAAYIVYIMWVAQRGKYRTSHYAIGSGMGALCIAVAGAISGVIQGNFGWTRFFVWVMFLSIPGLLSILFIPLDENKA